MKIKILILAAILSTINSQLTAIFAQGTLTPPGAPAPTMKSLTQIEPRTAIGALPYTISNPGSYYFTTNLTGQAAANGLTISASNVTLDLNGFALVGVGGSLDGVLITGLNVALRNGTICQWGTNGVDASSANNCQFEELRVSQNGKYGLYVGTASSVVNCLVQGNGGDGIHINAGGLVKDCSSSANGGSGVQSYSFNSTLPNLLITGCNLFGNLGNGINVSGDIVGNVCAGNAGAGIFVSSHGGRVEANHVLGNGSGITFGSSSTNLVIGNFIIGNTNSAISLFGSGNIIGPLVTATGTITNNNPWANFTY